MTEHKENELLRDLLLDAAAEEFAEEFAGTAHVETSSRFQKSMHSLLTDPNGWAKAQTASALEKGCQNSGSTLAGMHFKPWYADDGQP